MRAPSMMDLVMETKAGKSLMEQYQAEAMTKGLTEGRAKGLTEGRAKGLTEGRAKGLTEGRAKGLTEGLTKGETDTRNSIAQNMKSSGMPDKLISKYTGLPLSKVKNLKVPGKTREKRK